ncbi:MAG: ABC transporter ATP-binding protein [Alphaproteobacteria bacterium]|nr:ABC transporter ATP-binding protein [Alphaproteobacteria bacterium]
MNNPVSVKIENVSRRFGNVQALDGVSMNFAAGRLHGMIGPAGSGKTTMLRIMLELLNKDSGSVTYFENGAPVAFEEIRDEIAYMPEKQSLYADLSIEEHMRFFADMYAIDKKTYAERAGKLYRITRLDKFKDRPAGKLSGGMYKKLGLMCSLLRSPRVILLDEPTNGVDPISRREFWDVLNQSAADGILVIMTTAYMDEAERCAEVHLIENGVVLDEGDPAELLKKEDTDNFDQFFIKRAQRNG